MDVFLDDIVNVVLSQVKDNVVPTLENATKQAKERILAPRAPPKSTDLCYLTDRLIVCSRPAPANLPTFKDVGRDLRKARRRPRPNVASPSGGNAPTAAPGDNDDSTEAATEGSQSQCQPNKELAKVSEHGVSDDSTSAEPPEDPNHDQARDNVDDQLGGDETMTVENPQEGGSDDGGPAEAASGQDGMEVDRPEMQTESLPQPEAAVPGPDTSTPTKGSTTEESTSDVESAEAALVVATEGERPMDTTPDSTNMEESRKPTDEASAMTSSAQAEDASEQKMNEAQHMDTTSPDVEGQPDKCNGGDTHPGSDTEAHTVSQTIDKEKSKLAGEIDESPGTMVLVLGDVTDSSNQKEKTTADSDSGSEARLKATGEGQSKDVDEHDTTSEPMPTKGVADPQTDANESTPGSEKESKSAPTTENEEQPKDADGNDVAPDTISTKDVVPTHVDEDENDSEPPALPDVGTESAKPNVAQHEVPVSKLPTSKNSPADITGYLDNRHGKNRYLAFSLDDEIPDDRTLLLFRRQIVQLGWWSPCMKRSETPSISRLLKACYAIHAFLELNPSNVAMVYCKNGKTRTAIVVSCYLKFAGLVQHSHEGFLHFLTKKGISNPEATWKQLPPSLHLFFRQFDSTVDMGGFLNRKPLLLRAIALQGIPVEDKPCLDIWDSSQRHIFTSHPEIWDKDDPVRQRMSQVSNGNKPTSQWADEEGFYKVNAILDGDFLLLCRFGGDFAKETNVHDPSKILFRYANTTGFLSGGCPYELPAHKVDLMRQYANHLTDDDFLVTLLFEGDWEQIDGESMGEDGADGTRLSTPSNACSERVWKKHEAGACEEGLQIIFQRHSANPDGSDIRNFKMSCRSKKVSKCREYLLCLALQLTNFDYGQAERVVVDTPSFAWWSEQNNDENGNKLESDEEKKDMEKHHSMTGEQNDSAEQDTSKQILDLLMDVDVTSYLETPDVDRFRELEQLAGTQNSMPLTGSTNGDLGRDGIIGHSEGGSIPCTNYTGWMVPSILSPHSGDIVRSFGSTLAPTYPLPSNNIESHPFRISDNKPAIPLFPREKPAMIPPPPKRRRQDEIDSDKDWPMPPYTPQRETATELLMRLRHTGVNLSGLLDLTESSRQWSHVPMVDDEPEEVEDGDEDKDQLAINNSESRDATMNREAKEMQEKKWKEATKAQAEEKEGKKKADEAKRKGPEEKEAETKAKEKVEAEKKQEDKSSDATSTKQEKPSDGDPALKDDSDYSKYFKMLKMGMAKEQVLHAMKRDDKDTTVLDLDPNKSLKSQRPEDPKPADGEVPLKDDPEYSKYFKMLQMGLPIGAVKNALTRDEKDPTIMDLDPKKSLKSQRQPEGGADDGPPLKEDPDYQKYFKMLKMGLPMGAVKNALTKDGKDPGIMDLDPEKSLKSQTAGSGGADDGPPLKEDPEYAKYFKMLTMGLPIGAVKNALSRDGKDPSIMDLDPNKSVKSQLGGGAEEEDTGPPLKEDPDYMKYFKMLTMGLPIGAVKNALSRDGKDPAIMDLDPNKSLKAQLGGAEERDTGIPLKDDPEYTKYFKMAAMGLPPGAVKNAMERDGKSAAVLDLDPNKSVAFQMKKKGGSSKKTAKKKKRVRRKKIYWNPIDPGKMKKDSMWSIVRGSVIMDKLNYDPKEFEDLFTESADPADKKKKKKSGGESAAKKLVQVIDGKRSMNGGIILARLKTDYSKIAGYVDKMEHGKFDSTQLSALKEYLADADERRGLAAYMEKGKKSPEVKDKLYSEFSETEKYMWTMMEVQDAPSKFDALLFRTNFKSRFEDISSAIRTLNAACDELRSSQKLRKLMAMILTVVNQINTGGEGNMAVGFTLDALLKLNEAKAFDKKTSVLHYVVKLVKKNDPTLLAFSGDLGSVVAAENIMLDSLNSDVSSLGNDLSGVHETVKKEADRLEQAGELKPMTLADLAEQRTVVKQVGSVPQYNKTDHLTGRTAMERFSVNAKVACEEASDSISDVKKKYSALVQYFDEDEQIATSDFFGTFRRFFVEWDKAVEQVEAIEKKEAKEKKKAAAKAEKEAKRAAAKAAKSGGTASKGKKHVQLPKLLKRRSADKQTGAGNPATKDSPVEQTPKEGDAPSRAGGIAAFAAAAARRITKGSSEAKAEDSSNPATGIAAFAAAAARRKGKDGSDANEDDKASPAGGIAAFAAAAARHKGGASEAKKDGDASPAGGIAAFAAAAARRKESAPATKKDDGVSPAGGIAAFAAAAARRKEAAAEANKDGNGSPAGGIAAFAAAAARRKQSGPATKKDEDVSSAGGTAAFAAAAAGPKEVTPEAKTDVNAGSTEGIAAFAAAAAKRKEKDTSEKGGDTASPAGGIAAFAAAAAGRKGKDASGKEDDNTHRQTGGIAASVAAAAGVKQDVSGDNKLGLKEVEAASPVSGIGDDVVATHQNESVETNVAVEPSPAGGIAAAAVAAAKLKMQSYAEESTAPPVEHLRASDFYPSKRKQQNLPSEQPIQGVRDESRSQETLADSTDEPDMSNTTTVSESRVKQNLACQENDGKAVEPASIVETKDSASPDETLQETASIETIGRDEALVPGEPVLDAGESKVKETPVSGDGADPETPQAMIATTNSGSELNDLGQTSSKPGSNDPAILESQPQTASETLQNKAESQDASKVLEEGPENLSKKSGFAAKAAAYRRRKVRKEDKDNDEKDVSADSGMREKTDNRGDNSMQLDGDVGVGASIPILENNKDHDSNPVTVHAHIQSSENQEATEMAPNGHGSNENMLGELITALGQSIESKHIQPVSPKGGPSLASFLEGNSKGNDGSKQVKTASPKRGPGLASFLESNSQQNDGRKQVQPSSPDSDPGLASFLEGGSTQNKRLELLQQNLDDSSVAMLAENLQKQQMDSRMSTTWTEGDTIPNWMNWANEVIQQSDTLSVQGFEESRDLNDPNDYDDDSTIATMNDDMSVASGTTPGRISSYISFENEADPGNAVAPLPLADDGLDPVPVVTPAKVAASILFEDSSASSVEHTPSTSNVHRNHDQELVDMGLSFATGGVGLDTGLSFGADDVGLDDGLGFGGDYGGDGFGGDGYGLGGDDDLDDGNADKRKKWFPWAK